MAVSVVTDEPQPLVEFEPMLLDNAYTPPLPLCLFLHASVVPPLEPS